MNSQIAANIKVTWINFHGIGEVSRPYEDGEEPYWISVDTFDTCLDQIAGEMKQDAVRVSFDDGNLSDLEIACPRLADRGVTALFFILAGRLDRPGFLSAANLREMTERGMAIGSHGWDHRDLRKLNDADIAQETETSKKTLEDATGQPVKDFSIPFGLYDKRVFNHVRNAGYERIYTSDRGFARADSRTVRRNSIRSDDIEGSFSKWVRGDHGPLAQYLDDLRCFVKRNR